MNKNIIHFSWVFSQKESGAASLALLAFYFKKDEEKYIK